MYCRTRKWFYFHRVRALILPLDTQPWAPLESSQGAAAVVVAAASSATCHDKSTTPRLVFCRDAARGGATDKTAITTVVPCNGRALISYSWSRLNTFSAVPLSDHQIAWLLLIARRWNTKLPLADSEVRILPVVALTDGCHSPLSINSIFGGFLIKESDCAVPIKIPTKVSRTYVDTDESLYIRIDKLHRLPLLMGLSEFLGQIGTRGGSFS